ncbi:MAG TPA: 3-oxoacyl-[acyl-carrier-protein] synthase III C-terminal domain-containing protein [Polyangiaceae bacterium]|nr:3-oxoacyl-[acyl-carrier-protein] synthase III C-terminal domain-containing protein [Polyangiaceae bacterium]
MPHIVSAATALPEHYYSQNELCSALLAMGDEGHTAFEQSKVLKFFSSVAVGGRHLALPLGRYARLGGLGERSALWLEAALELGQRAVGAALERAGLAPADVGLFVTSTVTGIAVPSLEARLMNRLDFSPHCRRLPLFGLGCAAGAAGIARVSDHLRGHPREAALLLCVELCSLTFQRDDLSTTNIIASGLFGDGAACVLLVGDEHPLAKESRAKVVTTRSVFFRDTERVMGWDVVDTGFRIVLGAGVPEIARTRLAAAVRGFLSEQGLAPRDVARWVAHPGGPAVITAMEQSLELESHSLALSRDCLARVGNLSSASVLVILEQTLADRAPQPGSPGLLLAMGPGFAAELVLLQW